MNMLLQAAVLMALFFAMMVLIDSSNPCSQFSDYPEQCSQQRD